MKANHNIAKALCINIYVTFNLLKDKDINKRAN